MWSGGFSLFFITVTVVFAIDVLPSECEDESAFCYDMAADGACYSEDESIRSDMHDLCPETCKTCSESIPSCDDGTETTNNETGTSCCHVNDVFNYSYTEYKADGLTYRNFSNESSGCLFIPIPLIWGEIWWYWLVIIAIGGLALGLLIAWFMFGQRNEYLDKLLEDMGNDSGQVKKKASEMTKSDITKITEYYKMMAAISTYETKGFVEEDSMGKTPGGKPDSPYLVLVSIFRSCTVDSITIVDKAEFNMVIATLGISPMQLDIANVFRRLDDGSGKITVDQLYKAIEVNFKIAESEIVDDYTDLLRVAIIKTFVRERRASLSILKKYEDVHRTAGETPGYDDPYEAQTPDGLIRTETVFKVVAKPDQKLLRSHDFNAFLLSMGVPISESDILERVLKLEAMQPEGIDVIEFKYMLDEDIRANPNAVKSDLIVKVLDHLINRHGGQDLAKNALKSQHEKEEFLTRIHTQLSLSNVSNVDDAKVIESMIREMDEFSKQTPQ